MHSSPIYNLKTYSTEAQKRVEVSVSGPTALKAMLAALQGRRADSPKGEAVNLCAGVSDHATCEAVESRTFAAVPSLRSLRWLIPLDNQTVTRSALQLYTPYTLHARLLYKLLKAVIPLGNAWARDRVVFDSPGEPWLSTVVQSATGEKHPIFALSRGVPPRLVHVTVQVMRPDGSILGFAKLPTSDAAEVRLRNEGSWLRRLSADEALRESIPRIISDGDCDAGYFLFQSAGPSASGPTHLTSAHYDFLSALHAVDACDVPAPKLLAQARQHWELLSPYSTTAELARFSQALDVAEQLLSNIDVRCGCSHGDFAPINTKYERQRLFVFDWERAASGVPCMFDEWHFQVQVAHWYRRPPQSLLADARFNCDLDEPQTRGLLLLYLLDSSMRWMKPGGPQHDGVCYRARMIDHLLAEKR